MAPAPLTRMEETEGPQSFGLLRWTSRSHRGPATYSVATVSANAPCFICWSRGAHARPPSGRYHHVRNIDAHLSPGPRATV